jgi:hypothetical protein
LLDMQETEATLLSMEKRPCNDYYQKYTQTHWKIAFRLGQSRFFNVFGYNLHLGIKTVIQQTFFDQPLRYFGDRGADS